MVSQVCDTGANFGADVALQIVLQPHLTTLVPGYTRVDAELKRLEGEGSIGLVPCRVASFSKAHELANTSPIDLGASPTPAGRISSCFATATSSLFLLTTLFATYPPNARTPATSLINTVTIVGA